MLGSHPQGMRRWGGGNSTVKGSRREDAGVGGTGHSRGSGREAWNGEMVWECGLGHIINVTKFVCRGELQQVFRQRSDITNHSH